MAGRGKHKREKLHFNAGKPWTEKEDKLIMETDLPDKTLSIKIGRTLSAIHNRRTLLYKSGELNGY